MDDALELVKFGRLDIGDPFFDSLKEDYPGFEDWFKRKSDKNANVLLDEDGKLEAFLYLKSELDEAVNDVKPSLPTRDYLKVGTLKVKPHGTRLGERLIKRAFDAAMLIGASAIYVTIFPKHQALVSLFEKYGFKKVATKQVGGDTEHVLLRDLQRVSSDMIEDYPLVDVRGSQKYLLGIYPKWHTQLLPDSKLHNESRDIIQDLSHTNSIHKTYICKMRDVDTLNRGDVLVVYRTKGENSPAEYSSVATSICVVEEIKTRLDFVNEGNFVEYCSAYSVFTKSDLRGFWKDWNRIIVIRFTYNLPLNKRVIRRDLIQKAGLPRDAYWGFMPVPDDAFRKILNLGEADDRYIID